ncbi:MAG: phosphotransferase enzyme family protein [Pseudonocardiaceae bacterium]
MSAPTTGPHTDIDTVAAALAADYRLSPTGLRRLPIGQGTVNYRVRCAHRDVFVKCYPTDADLHAEREAIALSSLAGRHGVPVAAVVPTAAGEPISTRGPVAISVWEWVEGRTVTDQLSTAQQRVAGAALGRIHTAFAPLPASSGPAPQVASWRGVDLAPRAATIDRLLALITERKTRHQADEFDTIAEQTLTQRATMLTRIPSLLAELPELTAQVLHGDYSPVNILFDGDELTAVIDFRPPDPFFIAYDLGRMAFYPNTVARDETWMQAAATLIAGYLQTNPTVPAHDIRACARVALLQLLASLYGVKQHYLKPGLFQDDLDEFWLLRHHTAQVLLGHLTDTDDLLAGLAAAPRR